LALAVLVRPSAIGLVPLLGIVAARVRRKLATPLNATAHTPKQQGANRARGFSIPFFHGFLALFIILSVLYPWAKRNSMHPALERKIWTTTNNGITLYDGFNPLATGASNQKDFLDAFKPALKNLDELGRDRFFRERAIEWIHAHPKESFRLALVKIGRTWSPVPLSSEYGSKAYVAIGLIYTVPVYGLFFIGLWRGVGGKTLKALCVLPAIYFTGIHAASVGSLRYRVPCEPPMAVIAGAGAAMLLNSLRPARIK